MARFLASRTSITPAAFLARCIATGVTIDRADGTILTLTKRFSPGDKAGYTDAESACSLVYEAPGRGGSVWGTDGGSIGGMVGLNSGYCTLHKSCVSSRWLAELRKLLAPSVASKLKAVTEEWPQLVEITKRLLHDVKCRRSNAMAPVTACGCYACESARIALALVTGKS